MPEIARPTRKKRTFWGNVEEMWKLEVGSLLKPRKPIRRARKKAYPGARSWREAEEIVRKRHKLKKIAKP